jgi:hypothetical protein
MALEGARGVAETITAKELSLEERVDEIAKACAELAMSMYYPAIAHRLEGLVVDTAELKPAEKSA